MAFLGNFADSIPDHKNFDKNIVTDDDDITFLVHLDILLTSTTVLLTLLTE